MGTRLTAPVVRDEASPEEASIVTIALTPGEGGTTVTVTERLAGAAHASIGFASIDDLVGAADAGDHVVRRRVRAGPRLARFARRPAFGPRIKPEERLRVKHDAHASPVSTGPVREP